MRSPKYLNASQYVESILSKTTNSFIATFVEERACLRGSEYILHGIID